MDINIKDLENLYRDSEKVKATIRYLEAEEYISKDILFALLGAKKKTASTVAPVDANAKKQGVFCSSNIADGDSNVKEESDEA